MAVCRPNGVLTHIIRKFKNVILILKLFMSKWYSVIWATLVRLELSVLREVWNYKTNIGETGSRTFDSITSWSYPNNDIPTGFDIKSLLLIILEGFFGLWKNQEPWGSLTTNTYLNRPFTACNAKKHYAKPLCEFIGYQVNPNWRNFENDELREKFAKCVAVWTLYWQGLAKFSMIMTK